jgi:Kef-type K+ transport system membrane component KefB
MVEGAGSQAATVFVVGVLTVSTLLLKSGLGRMGLPSLIGFLAIGMLLRMTDAACGVFNAVDLEILEFLGKAGLVTLLFRVGLESNLKGLLGQLRKASVVWVVDVSISGTLGYLTSFYLLGLGALASLVVAIAFTATSVGITVAVWQEMKALKSPSGELLLDLAELDDISAVVLMALLFAQLPQLTSGGEPALPALGQVGFQVGLFLLKLVSFGFFCFLFSRWVEKPVSRFFQKLESTPDLMLSIAGIGFMIAALADLMGFSMAIGAFFAGLIFSRDPETVKLESSFVPIYDFLSPFFFVSIGMRMEPTALDAAALPAAVLAAAAICGKLFAVGVPLLLTQGRRPALLIGVSMIPRAEITMAIMQRAHAAGDWAVPGRIYNAMIVVAAVTCLLGPFSVQTLLKRWPRTS